MKKNEFDKQVDYMHKLMNYGLQKESKQTNSTSDLKDTLKCADGNVYGIVKENHNFYIKVCESKKPLVAENFNYIGGIQNKKDYEYNSYTVASRQLELKVKTLNESRNKKGSVHVIDLDRKEELVIESTNKMGSEIKRQREIMLGAAKIMNEDKTIGFNNTGVPEAPKTTTFKPSIGTPFEETKDVVEDPNKEHTASCSNHETCGGPFEEKPKKMKEKTPSKNFKPVKKVNENIFDGDFNEFEGEEMDQFTSQDNGVEGEYEEGYYDYEDENGDDFQLDFEEEEHDDVNPFKLVDRNAFESKVFTKKQLKENYMDKMFMDMNKEDDMTGEFEGTFGEDDGVHGEFHGSFEDDEFNLGGDDYMDDQEVYEFSEDDLYEMVESVLNDFGKHPSYQKQSMTLPSNTEPSCCDVEDWHDESIKSNNPFGSKIGSSDPYTSTTKTKTIGENKKKRK